MVQYYSWLLWTLLNPDWVCSYIILHSRLKTSFSNFFEFLTINSFHNNYVFTSPISQDEQVSPDKETVNWTRTFCKVLRNGLSILEEA